MSIPINQSARLLDYSTEYFNVEGPCSRDYTDVNIPFLGLIFRLKVLDAKASSSDASSYYQPFIASPALWNGLNVDFPSNNPGYFGDLPPEPHFSCGQLFESPDPYDSETIWSLPSVAPEICQIGNIPSPPLHPHHAPFCDLGSITVNEEQPAASSQCFGTVDIPQRSYKAPGPTRKYRPGDQAALEEPITFVVQKKSGILVRHALEEKFSGLSGSLDDVFTQSGTSIALRFEWPGYEPWSHQIKTKDWRKVPRPITRSKLATEIAKKLDQFIKEMEDEIIDESFTRWRVGRGFINIDNLILVSLEQVSKGSWQPRFRLVE